MPRVKKSHHMIALKMSSLNDDKKSYPSQFEHIQFQSNLSLTLNNNNNTKEDHDDYIAPENLTLG